MPLSDPEQDVMTMPLETLIQTRIPRETADVIAKLAAAEGLSMAAWVRRVVIREVTSPTSDPARIALAACLRHEMQEAITLLRGQIEDVDRRAVDRADQLQLRLQGDPMSTEIKPPNITTATGQDLINALVGMDANKPCSRCGHNDFAVLSDQIQLTMLTPMPHAGGDTVNVERRVLVSAAVCRVCRAVTFHGHGPSWGSTVKPADARTA